MIAIAKKVLLFTSQDIGFSMVEILARREGLSLLVITDRTIRDDSYGYRSAVDACEARGVQFVRSARVDEYVRARIIEFGPELIVCAYYPHLIPSDIIGLPIFGAINIHPGRLPFYRGKFPTPWYILNEETSFGVAIHRLDGGIDTGDVLVQKDFPLGSSVTGHELYRQTMVEGARMFADNLEAILANSIEPEKQVGIGSYFSAIEKRYHIDWNHSVDAIGRRIRVHARPFLPAFSFLLNKIVFVNRSSRADLAGYTAQGGGRIVRVDESGRFAVSCSDGCLSIDDYDVFPPLSAYDHGLHLRVGNRLE